MIPDVVRNLLRMDGSMSDRVVRGGFWLIINKIAMEILGFIRLIVIARILLPREFGIMGVALLVMAILDILSTTGFQQALIQRKGDVNPYLDSAWTFLVLRSFGIAAILILIAPYAGVFFQAPEAVPVIQVMGLSQILQAFTNIAIIFFRKNLDFSRQFYYEFVSTIIDFSVAIIAVLILRNVWALVLGYLAGNAARLVMSYLLHPYRPHFRLDMEKARQLFGYGRWVFASLVLVFLSSHVNDFLVGGLLGVTMLAFYEMAYKISNLVMNQIINVVEKVTFPAYSKIQDSQIDLSKAYFRIVKFTTLISIPIGTAIIILAQPFTSIFLGENWAPIVPVMQVLALGGIVRSIISAGGPFFMGAGYPNYDFFTKIIWSAVLLVSVYPLILNFGITGGAISFLLSYLAMGIIWVPLSQKITKTPLRDYLQIFWPPIASAAAMGVALWALVTLWNPAGYMAVPAILVFGGICLLGFVVFIATLQLIQKLYPSYQLNREVITIIKTFI